MQLCDALQFVFLFEHPISSAKYVPKKAYVVADKNARKDFCLQNRMLTQDEPREGGCTQDKFFIRFRTIFVGKHCTRISIRLRVCLMLYNKTCGENNRFCQKKYFVSFLLPKRKHFFYAKFANKFEFRATTYAVNLYVNIQARNFFFAKMHESKKRAKPYKKHTKLNKNVYCVQQP